jgi:hypothetical protein
MWAGATLVTLSAAMWLVNGSMILALTNDCEPKNFSTSPPNHALSNKLIYELLLN